MNFQKTEAYVKLKDCQKLLTYIFNEKLLYDYNINQYISFMLPVAIS